MMTAICNVTADEIGLVKTTPLGLQRGAGQHIIIIIKRKPFSFPYTDNGF